MENRHMVADAYEAFRRGWAADFARALQADSGWDEVDDFPYGGPPAPEAALTRFFLGIEREWEDCHLDVEEVLEAGDRVVALGSYRGRDRATGRPVQASFAHVWTLHGGRVVKLAQYTDWPRA